RSQKTNQARKREECIENDSEPEWDPCVRLCKIRIVSLGWGPLRNSSAALGSADPYPPQSPCAWSSDSGRFASSPSRTANLVCGSELLSQEGGRDGRSS